MTDFITIMCGFRFSVRTGGREPDDRRKVECDHVCAADLLAFRENTDQGLCHISRPGAVGKRFKQRDNKTRVRFVCGAANSRAWRSASPEAAGNHEPLFQQHRSKVSPRFSCLIRNLAPLPLSSVACGLLPKRSPPSSELGASHSCDSAPITSGPSRRRTKGPPRPQPWRNSISMKNSASG